MSRAPHPLVSPWSWAIPALCLLGAAAVWLLDLNQGLFLWLNGLGRGAAGSVFWANTTILGDTLVAFALLGLFARRRPDIVWALLLAALFTTAWVHILKPLIDNPRPLAVLGADMVNVIGANLRSNSFPSGHTATAFTLAGVICLRGVHPALGVGCLLLAVLAGLSRAAVGAHWPLDILAGAFGGWLAAAIGVTLSRRWPTPESTTAQTLIGMVLLGCGLSLLLVHDTEYPAHGLQTLIAILSITSVTWFLFRLYWLHRP
jgi:membrane-associated phospholipid phosphatase